MHVAVRARHVLARRPWIYWLCVAGLAAIVAVAVDDRLDAIEQERSRWGATRTVLVADGALEAGDSVVARRVELPLAALPDATLSELTPDARMRQRATDGEVLTSFDVTSRPGAAGRADAGEVVVAVSDPLARNVVIATNVQIVADGLVLADSGEVVEVVDEVVFVAVDERDGPIVAAAAQQGIAALVYLPDDR
jgi:translation initiation factor IF-2